MTTTLIQSSYATPGVGGFTPAPNPDAANVCAYRASIALTAGQVALDTILEMGPLLAGCQLLDVIVDTDQLDTSGSATLTFKVGLMSGTFGDDDVTRTCDASIATGATTAQAGGVLRPTLATAFRELIPDVDTSIGIELTAAAATAAAGTIGITVLYTG